jgi:hypothetical protein
MNYLLLKSVSGTRGDSPFPVPWNFPMHSHGIFALQGTRGYPEKRKLLMVRQLSRRSRAHGEQECIEMSEENGRLIASS